jgi:hypothetical protein
MTDEQWLRAIERYHSEHRIAGGDDLKGGARELARTLEVLVIQQPERFAKLALRLPSDANPAYLDRLLAGLGKSTISNELKLGVCRKAFTDAREACGRAIADVLGASEDRLPTDAINMLVWLATEHPDPDHEAWQRSTRSGSAYFNGDIYANGINTSRGCAAEAISDLIGRDVVYVPPFREALERMVRDPSTCVRSCVAGTLNALAHHDADSALALFERMDVGDDRLLATVHVYRLIQSLLRDHLDELRPTIERMLRSSDSDVAQAGARLAGLASLHHERAADLAREAASGDAPRRRGLAEIAAANIALDSCRIWCEGHLAAFFNDTDEEVRKEAATAFRHLDGASLEDYESLIIAFADSVAYRDDSVSVLHLLKTSAHRLPGITCVVCEKFLDHFCEKARNGRIGIGDAHTITQLIFRTYHQHQNDEWTQPALDLIDRLCLEGIGDARKALDEFER